MEGSDGFVEQVKQTRKESGEVFKLNHNLGSVGIESHFSDALEGGVSGQIVLQSITQNGDYLSDLGS